MLLPRRYPPQVPILVTPFGQAAVYVHATIRISGHAGTSKESLEGTVPLLLGPGTFSGGPDFLSRDPPPTFDPARPESSRSRETGRYRNVEICPMRPRR